MKKEYPINFFWEQEKVITIFTIICPVLQDGSIMKIKLNAKNPKQKITQNTTSYIGLTIPMMIITLVGTQLKK